MWKEILKGVAEKIWTSLEKNSSSWKSGNLISYISLDRKSINLVFLYLICKTRLENWRSYLLWKTQFPDLLTKIANTSPELLLHVKKETTVQIWNVALIDSCYLVFYSLFGHLLVDGCCQFRGDQTVQYTQFFFNLTQYFPVRNKTWDIPNPAQIWRWHFITPPIFHKVKVFSIRRDKICRFI